jgi:hypothetical protein
MRKELVSGSNNDVIMHQFHTAKVKTTQVMIGAGLIECSNLAIKQLVDNQP